MARQKALTFKLLGIGRAITVEVREVRVRKRNRLLLTIAGEPGEPADKVVQRTLEALEWRDTPAEGG